MSDFLFFGTAWASVLLSTCSSFVFGVNTFVYAVSVVRYGVNSMECFDGWDNILLCIFFEYRALVRPLCARFMLLMFYDTDSIAAY